MLEKGRRVIITGFGPFMGVKENPCILILEDIFKDFSKYSVFDAKIVETSVQGVNNFFEEFKKKHSFEKDDKNDYIFLHLGVAASRVNFHLECRACNNATFSIPDERNNLFENCCINEDCKLNTFLYSDLKIDKLRECLNKCVSKDILPKKFFPRLMASKSGKKEEVKKKDEVDMVVLSNDAGKYICNYMYYKSLNFTKDLKNCFSLFVHIPHHTTIDIEHQKKFIKDLTNNLMKI